MDDDNNWCPAKVVDATDWRTELQPSSRQRIITMIMETLKRHLLISEQEGLIELNKVAVRFEENVFTAATSQSDYLRIISSKMLVMETDRVVNSSPLSIGGGGQNPQDQAYMHQQQAPVLHPQQPSQQQQMNALNLQNNQLIGQQNNVSDVQQQQQLQGLLNQQNYMANMQQRLGQQSNMSGLQNQRQQPMHTTHRHGGRVQGQQNTQLPANSLQIQRQYTQSQLAQQQIMSQHPSQTTHMFQQLRLQQQPSVLQRDVQQWIHSQKPASSTTIDAAIAGNVVDVQEEIFQAIKSMRDKYLPDLSDMYRKISQRCQQLDSLTQPPASEQIEKLERYKNGLDKMMRFLNLPKSSLLLLPNWKEKFASHEEKILNILRSYRAWKTGGVQQKQIQPTDGHPLFGQQQRLQQLQQQQQIQPTDGHPLFILQQQQQQQQIQATDSHPLFIQQQQLQQLQQQQQQQQQRQ